MTLRYLTVPVATFISLAAAASEPVALPVEGDHLQVRAADGLRFSPDGKWLIASVGESDNTSGILVWDVATRIKAAEFASPQGDIFCMAVSPHGHMLATGHSDSIHIWNFERGWDNVVPTELIGDAVTQTLQRRPHLREKARRVGAMAFSPDGQTLAWTWADDRLHLWSVSSGEELNSLPVRVPYTSYGGGLHFLSNEQVLTMGIKSRQRCEMRVWDVDSGLSRTLPIPRGGLSSCAAVSADRRLMAALVDDGAKAASGQTSRPTELWLWDLESGQSRRVGPGPQAMLFGPAFSPDGTLALGTYSNQPSRLENIVLLDVRTRRAKEVLPLTRRGACPAQLTFSPNGEYLAAAVFFDRAPVYLWRLEADSKSRAGR